MSPGDDAVERPESNRPARRGTVLLAIAYVLATLVVLYIANYELAGAGRFLLSAAAIGVAPFVGLALGRRLSKTR